MLQSCYYYYGLLWDKDRKSSYWAVRGQSWLAGGSPEDPRNFLMFGKVSGHWDFASVTVLDWASSTAFWVRDGPLAGADVPLY
jgi:hypothetical protein